jgi:phosphatidylglycerol---prolipoprotein diacylglyceryl transferase
MDSLLLTIKIGIDPEIGRIGGLLLTWHGVFIALAIGLGVWLGVWFGRRAGFTEDDAYTAALIAVPAGIIGARALFVAENWDLFSDDWLDIFRINEGGISLYGSLVFGVAAALAYGFWRRLPILKGLDAASFGMILGQGIGRIGCVVAGDIFAKSSDLPFSVVYTNVNSLSFARPPMHFVTAYEVIGDFLILGVLFGLWKFRIFKRDGLLFFIYAFLYSAMRFGISFLRVDKEIAVGLGMAQLIALAVIAVSVVVFVAYAYAAIRRRRVSESEATA